MPNRTFLHVTRIGLTICLIFALPYSAWSQATSGTLLGRVTDPSKAVVTNAEVVATNLATGASQAGKTDGGGDFVLLNLSPGLYSLSVKKDGFETATIDRLELFIDQRKRVDVELKIGSVTSVAEVTVQPTLLQTDSVETGEVIQNRQIQDLPMVDRNFLALSLLTPGVVRGGGGNTLNLAVNGQREFGNSVMIDGIESTANRNNDTGLVPSVDAVQEFKIATSAYSAQFGRASGGVISIQTKAGTNKWHGSLYEYYRPSETAARQDVLNGGQSFPSPLNQHNFGGTFGGPVRKDKTFFFASYEQVIHQDASIYVNSVPPINQLKFLPNGDVDASGLIDPATGNQIPIFDPSITYANYGGYAQQFPGNIIPAASISPAGLAVLKNFFPMPNLPGDTNGWYDNFQVNAPSHYGKRSGDMRVDQEFSQKNHLSVVYHYSDYDARTSDPFSGATTVVGAGDVDQGDKTNFRDQQLSANWTHFFSTKILNEFRFGYTRYRLDQLSLLNGTDYSSQFGVGNISVPNFPATDGFPVIYLGSGYQTGGSYYKPLYFTDSNFQFVDNLTFSQVGNHEFHAGADFRRLNSHPGFSIFPTGFQYYTGPYSYAPFSPNSSDPTYTYFYDPNAAFPNGGSDITDLLFGLPASTEIGLQLVNPHTQSWEMHFYGEDVWRVTPKLTVTYGVRYEFQNPYTEAHNNASLYDLQSNRILIAGRGGNSAALMNARKNDFSPRVGFAYRLSPKTVFRAGYGLFYSAENDARSDKATQSYPFSIEQVFSNSIYDGAPTYTLDAGLPRITTVPIDSTVSSIDPATIPNGRTYNTYYIDPNLKTGYSQLFNVTVQREISSSLTAEVAYVGSRSHDLSYAIGNINQGGVLTPDFGEIEALESLGWGTYNSLQAKVTQHLRGGLNFLASYTYGHNIDNGPAPFNLGRNHNQPQNPYDLNAEIASSDDDVRHNFVLSGSYQLPFGKGKRFFSDWSGVPQAVLGGWQLNTIFTAQTGLPINVVANGNNTIAPGLRPNLVGDPYKDIPDGFNFNTAAFCVPGPSSPTCPDLGPGGVGNAGRNILRSLGYVDAEVSLFKEFAVRESSKLQLQVSAFNFTNTPHFDFPGSDLSSKTTFGKIKTAGDPRVLQFAVKYIF